MTALRPNTRRQLLLGSATLALLAACGGGGSPSTPSYGGGHTPGSVTMTVTNTVTLTTNYGDIKLGLDATHAPISTANFLAYVNSGAYTNTIFHRVVPNFVIQGGGYTSPAVNGSYPAIATRAAIALESRNGLSNTLGTLAMARTSVPDSATSQFYINTVDNAGSLDYPATDGAGYAVFGKVMDAASMTVVNTIAGVALQGSSGLPVQDVIVLSAVQTQ